MSDVIEKMAERFYDHDCYNSATCDMPADWEFFAQENINRDRVARYRLNAQAALTILEQDGWQRVPEGSVVVPREAVFNLLARNAQHVYGCGVKEAKIDARAKLAAMISASEEG